ncbi:MAG: DNA-processing protein DprA, partial [Candidatus Absconditabacterales bacterium]
PQIIYYMGNLDILNQTLLGIVGPRLPSIYGEQVVTELLDYAKSYQLATISGLADGIDTLCYQQSIKNNIPTIAVLGGGFHYFLRTRQYDIDTIIGNGGLVMSEFKIGNKPEKYTFPQRNRIIAGLSDILFLPEAATSSGSLITVDFAYKVHKSIYATPNSIFQASSSGINQYISKGIIQAVRDIPEFIQKNFPKKEVAGVPENNYDLDTLSEAQQQILQVFTDRGSTPIEVLLQKTGLSTSILMSELTILEISGHVYQHHPGLYAIKN